jgi:AhpD family alkylhydroperoxidase
MQVMTHISPLPARGAGLFVRFAYWMARRRLGKVPLPLQVMAHHRSVLAAVAGFELSIERASALDPKLKGLADLKAALLVACPFCVDIGSSMAIKHGLTPAQIRDLAEHESSSEFSPLERMVLDYTVAMSATPSAPQPELFAALERELGRRGIVELTAVIAWENFRARFNHAIGAQSEGFAAVQNCRIPKARSTHSLTANAT